MTHRRKRIFSSLKKRKKVDRVITTQPTLTTNIFFRLIFVVPYILGGGNKIEKKLFFLYVFQLHFILHELGNIE